MLKMAHFRLFCGQVQAGLAWLGERSNRAITGHIQPPFPETRISHMGRLIRPLDSESIDCDCF